MKSAFLFLNWLKASKSRFFAVAAVVFALAAGGARAKTVTIDGLFDDWSGISPVFSDSLDSYPFSGTTYYFNLASDSWQANDPGYGTCMFNENRALEVSDLWMTNDNNYLYFKIRRGATFANYYWLRGGEPEWSSFYNEPASSFNSNPCAGHIVTAPHDFRHDMVFNFDKDQDGKFDYYLGFDVIYNKGAYVDKNSGRTGKDFYTLEVHIMGDNGNGVYDGNGNEVLLSDLQTGEYKISYSAMSDEGGVLQELRVNLGKLLASTGMKQSDLANVRYSSHSEIANTTSTGDYTFGQDSAIRLKAHILSKTKKQSVRVAGKTKKGAELNLLLDGVDQGAVRVGAKGRFSERLPVSVGTHTVQLMAFHSEGTSNLSRVVVRKATRAADMPLMLDIIHSKNETGKPTLVISGTAYGVARVRVSVNGADWGYVAVKRKTGYYKTEIILEDGENTIAVTATDGTDTITQTKMVRKL